MNELISIIIPTYNHEKYIGDALQSVMSQTYSNWECIVINDGSNDKTEDIILELMKESDKIKYYYQINTGESAARNNGFKYSKGEYILFLDSDDLLKKDHLQILIAPFKEFDVDIAFCDTQRFVDRGNLFELVRGNNCKENEGIIPYDKLYRLLFAQNFITIHSALIKRKVFEQTGGFITYTNYLEDYAFWLSAARLKNNFYHINSKTALYRVPGKEKLVDKKKIIGRKNSELRFLTVNYDKGLLTVRDYDKRIKMVYRQYIRMLLKNGHTKACKTEISNYRMKYFRNPEDLIRVLEYRLKLLFKRPLRKVN